MSRRASAKTSVAELVAFEVATRDLVGLALRSVEHQSVSLSQFRLLLVLHELGRASSTHCAQALGVVGSSVTRMADRLHASGHLIRGADPGNRSVVTLELTESGRQVVRQVTAHRRRELRRVLDRLAPTDRSACAAVLEQLHGIVADAGTEDQRGRLPL